MSDAYKCDRCHEYQDGQPQHYYAEIGILNCDQPDFTWEADVCETCKAEIVQETKIVLRQTVVLKNS